MGRSHEGLAEARAILAEAEAVNDAATTAVCNRSIGWFCLQLGYPDEGVIAANAARTYYASKNDDWGYSLSLAVYSWLVLEIGLSDISFDTASEAVVVAARTEDQALNAFALNCKSIALLMSKEDDLAHALLEQALQLAEASGDESTLALTLVNIGFALFREADEVVDVEAAKSARLRGLEVNQRAINAARHCGDLWNLRIALCNAAEPLARIGQPEDALDSLAEAEALPGMAGPRGEGHYFCTKGDILEHMNRNDEAVESYMQAEKLALIFMLHDQMVQTFKRLADINAKIGNFRNAYLYHQTYHQAYVRQVSEMVRQRTMVIQMQLQMEALRKRAEELEMQVGIDTLTNVPNRRSFNRDFEELSHRQAVVGIIDIDYFKHVNDFYSHAVGDVVLQRVAQTISTQHEDMRVYRIGGEEFAVLFIDMSLEQADPLANRAVKAVRSLDFGNVAENLQVTISIGLVESGILSGSALLAEADRRLYVAKKSGRDRVISDNRPSPMAVPAE